MPPYRQLGDVPDKRHVVHRQGPHRLSEELMGEAGFAGSSTLLYHRHSPSALAGSDRRRPGRAGRRAQRRPATPAPAPAGRAGGERRGHRAPPPAGQLPTCRWPSSPPPSAAGCTATPQGTSSPSCSGRRGVRVGLRGTGVGPGDYVVVPAGTTGRWVVTGRQPLRALVLEMAGHVGLPERYRTPSGQLREGAPFTERDLRGPGELVHEEGEDVEVLIRHRSGWTRHRHAHHPFDVVGWAGGCYPYVFNIADFEPITGRFHQPPPVHQTFTGPRLVVCSFVPRPLDFDPAAVPLPYHHANVDCDEVLFYLSGDFTSRAGSGVGPGSLTVHPAGFVHGPHPGAAEAALAQEPGRRRTEETAVMLDTFAPLGVTATAGALADPGYLTSWLAEPAEPAESAEPAVSRR